MPEVLRGVVVDTPQILEEVDAVMKAVEAKQGRGAVLLSYFWRTPESLYGVNMMGSLFAISSNSAINPPKILAWREREGKR